MDSSRSYVSARTDYTDNYSRASAAPPMAQPQPALLPSFFRICGCIECYIPSREVLEYDYTYDETSGKRRPQSYPRIRERGEYYIDSYNGEPWSCSFGTAEKVSRGLFAGFDVEDTDSDFCYCNSSTRHCSFRMGFGLTVQTRLDQSCPLLCGY